MPKDVSSPMGLNTDASGERLDNQAMELRNVVPVSQTNIAPRGGVSLVNHYQQLTPGRQIWADGLPNALGNGILIVCVRAPALGSDPDVADTGHVAGLFSFYPRAVAPAYDTNDGIPTSIIHGATVAALDMGIPVPWSDGDDSHNFLNYFPFSLVMPEFFTPRPPALGTGGVGSPSWTDELGRAWDMENWFSTTYVLPGSNVNIGKVAVGWSATCPVEFSAMTLHNAYWPGSAWHTYVLGGGNGTGDGYFFCEFNKLDAPSHSTGTDPNQAFAGMFPGILHSGSGNADRWMMPGYAKGGKWVVWVYWDDDLGKTIPASTLRFLLTSNFTGPDKEFTIDSPIYSGVWNALEVSMPTKNQDAIFTDLNAVDQDGIGYNKVLFFLNAALAADLYTAGNKLKLYWTAGCQALDWTYTPASGA